MLERRPSLRAAGLLRTAAVLLVMFEVGRCEASADCEAPHAQEPKEPRRRKGLSSGSSFIQARVKVGAATHREQYDVKVVSYNLYWWNVKQNYRWSALYDRIRNESPLDLIGFQECEDLEKIVNNSGLDGMEFYQGPNKPDYNPAPLAWRSADFEQLGEPGFEEIGKDVWGLRILTYVRLRHIPSGRHVLFANTHGPLGECAESQGLAWIEAVNAHRESGDIVFLTGDFNCIIDTPAMQKLTGVLKRGVRGNIDYILANDAVDGGGVLAAQGRMA